MNKDKVTARLEFLIAEATKLKTELQSVHNGEDNYKTVCVDLDGVLARYDGWKGHGVIGAPLSGASDLLVELQARDLKIVIFTTRGAGEVKDWLIHHELFRYVDEINTNSDICGNNTGKPVASFYIDDRAIRFKGSNSEVLGQIDNFKDWWKKED